MRFEATLPDEAWVDASLVAAGSYAVTVKWGQIVLGDRITLIGSRATLSELAHQILRLTEPEGADDGPVE